MKFNSLIIDNFLTIKHAELYLADRGLQLIQGVNADDSSASSNGAGKSSIVDAICWCLYGETAREVKGDAVVSRAAKKDCRVTLFISNGASRYAVTRHRKHSTEKNSLQVRTVGDKPGDHGTDLSKGTDSETQKLLEKIIGSSLEVFMAAVYSGQERMPDLPRMKDRELKTLIEEAAGLQRIEAAYALARERMNTVRNEQESAGTRLSTIRVNVERGRSTKITVQEKFDAFEAGRAGRVADVVALVEASRTEVKELEEDVARSKADYEQAERLIEEADEALATHKGSEATAAAAEAAALRIERSIDAGLLKRLQSDVTAVQSKIDNAATEVLKSCSACGTELKSMSVEDFVAHQTVHLEGAKKKLADAIAAAKIKVGELNEAKAKAAALRLKVPDVSALSEERRSLSAIVEAQVSKLANLLRLKSNLAFNISSLERLKVEVNPHAASLELVSKHIEDAIASEKLAWTSLEHLNSALTAAQGVVKVFGPAGVRAQILDTVTPFLNDRTSDYLSALSDGEITATWTTLTKSASGELKEKFSIDVTHAKGGESFAAISGGEKRKVRLACALALQDLVASRASQPIDLWIGDEIDDALDAAGLERLMSILDKKARERGTVLVISHSDLKDWCDEVTTVKKEGLWTSTVEGSLCV